VPPDVERLVLRDVRAFDPGERLDERVDVVIERGAFARLGPGAARDLGGLERTRVVEGRGRWLLPGLVDLHTHLREPGFEHKEDIDSGLRAAAAGGFVSVCPMPNTRPANDQAFITRYMRLRAREGCGVRVHPIGAITLGLRGEELAEFGALREAGAVGVSDDGRCVTNSAVMRRALEYARAFDLVVIQHAEDHALTAGAQAHEGATSTRLGLRGWPRVAEDVIVARDLLLLGATGGRYHLAHASTAGAAAMVREAKARGLRASAEVTPHHLLLTDAALLGYDTACKVNPPLREPGDVEALWAALADGTIDAVATDHAPHAAAEKDVPFDEAPPGMVGLELCLPLLVAEAQAGKVALGRLVDALTRAPCRVAGLEPPRLREGSPADALLFDPASEWEVSPVELQSKSSNTPFLGRRLRGRVEMTLVGGRVAFERPGPGGRAARAAGAAAEGGAS
jgi:dihydroorotase